MSIKTKFNKLIPFTAALIASLSILMVGFVIDSKSVEGESPINLITIFEEDKSLLISREGFFSGKSSSFYYNPQVTAKDNPYGETVKEEMFVELTGYSSTVDQTNSEPFITASGTGVRWGIVASNQLPFGTRIRIPEYFGDQIFVVEDRMNRRYSYPNADNYDGYVDIWFYNRQQANNFGRVRGIIEVLK